MMLWNFVYLLLITLEASSKMTVPIMADEWVIVLFLFSLVFGMQREQKNLDLTTSPSLYHRSSRDEGEVYTSVPVVVLTVHEAQEETHVKRSHFSYEAEDALPVGEVYLNKLSFFHI